ncbi:MAG: nitrite/sulfite reductase, partial [Alphaproteobacteria bacterium]
MNEIPPVPAPGKNGNGSAERWQPAAEPLVKSSDADELDQALGQLRSGVWEQDQWTAFRLRYGVYGQLQPGVQMMRIKVPGGILSFAQARAAAAVTRKYAKGDLHVTTRQAIQIYHVPTDDTPAAVRDLAAGGLTTREACGNTLRNFTACALAGICPREHVDAGRVAEELSRAWLRNPLVQHMPRKFKTTVSGCGTDCGSSGIHDLGLIATVKDGRQGFRVFAGGGTGGQPIAAVEVADFVTEDTLPAVVEALVRLHHRYSDRVNRNRARIKFLVKRFGADKFRALFTEELERVRTLPRRPWEKLAWRTAEEAPAPSSPGGIVHQHDGKSSIIVNPPLGLLSPDALDALIEIAESAGADHLRTTRDQNIAIIGVPADAAETLAASV